MLQESTDFFPDRFFDQICAQLFVPAEPHPSEAVGVRANASIVSVRTRMVFASAGTNGLSIVSIPATGTHNQALQQIPCSSLGNTSPLAVFLQLFGHRIKERCI